MLFALAGLACAPTARAATRPNFVILLADDLGYHDVGFHGCSDIPTPHLDRLAAEGVRCTDGYVSGVYCSPTRAGLLTGRYQQRFGHEFNPGGQAGPNADRRVGLPLDQTTLADRLKEAGYATGLVGKWHLGGAPHFHPQRRGFDEFFGFIPGAHGYFPHTAGILRGEQPVDEAEYLTDALAREAEAFIERHRSEPFLLYLAFNAVHTPLHATDERLAKFVSIENERRRTYAGMLSALDDTVGRVLAKLAASGLDENTLVIFFSDNGGPVAKGTTVNGSDNQPLRGSKRTTLEGGIRVPMALRWKGTLPAGGVYRQPVIQLDFLPTMLAAASVAIDPAWRLDGVNLLPHLLGENDQPPHETLYWRMGAQRAIRQGDWKLVQYARSADGEEGSDVGPTKLYHLSEDLGETQDLSEQEPERAKALEEAWQRWSSELQPPLWGEQGRRQGRRARQGA